MTVALASSCRRNAKYEYENRNCSEAARVGAAPLAKGVICIVFFAIFCYFVCALVLRDIQRRLVSKVRLDGLMQ